jgi:hypothetical protein
VAAGNCHSMMREDGSASVTGTENRVLVRRLGLIYWRSVSRSGPPVRPVGKAPLPAKGLVNNHLVVSTGQSALDGGAI